MITKVLLVDDEPDIRRIGKLSLEAVGKWTVVMAASGLEAIEVARRELPDLIILDVMMPDLDGPTTYGRLQAEPALAGIPVIFMTAKVQKAEIARYLQLGAAGVVSKPFDPMTLPDQIRQITADPRFPR